MEVKTFDLLNISPYLRTIHTDICLKTEYPYIIPWRCIYDYELLFIFGGELNLKTETEEYTLHSGDLFIIQPFVRHTLYKTPGSLIKLYIIHFDISYMGEENDFSTLDIYEKPIHYNLKSIANDKRLSNRPYYTLKNIEFPHKLTVAEPLKYIDIMNNALKIFTDKPFCYELNLKICLLQILQLIITDMNSIHVKKHLSIRERQLVNCIDYINSNFNQEIDFDMFAKETNITPNYFRKLFKELVGKSPNEYLIDLRINAAIGYMRTGMYSIAKISSLVGYDDFHYFSRLFKRRKNLSPSKFLEKIIQNCK